MIRSLLRTNLLAPAPAKLLYRNELYCKCASLDKVSEICPYSTLCNKEYRLTERGKLVE